MGSQGAIIEGTAPPAGRKPFYRLLYVQVIAAIALGAVVGHFAPEFGAAMPLSSWSR